MRDPFPIHLSHLQSLEKWYNCHIQGAGNFEISLTRNAPQARERRGHEQLRKSVRVLPGAGTSRNRTNTTQRDGEAEIQSHLGAGQLQTGVPLFDVFFVSKEEGWASGAAGTILHTKDGGNSWTAELGGDPHAEGKELKRIFFADATHGWAQAWNTLYRTTDGESWQEINGDIRGDAFFVSDLKGFRTYGGKIFATTDGGENWKEIFTCHAKMEVQGLTQE